MSGSEEDTSSVAGLPSSQEGSDQQRLTPLERELVEAVREAIDFISSHFENLSTGEIEGDAGEPLSVLYAAIAKAEGRL